MMPLVDIGPNQLLPRFEIRSDPGKALNWVIVLGLETSQ